MNQNDLLKTLQDISRILDDIKYECSGRIYVLDDNEMNWVFYCRDIADIAIKKYEESQNESK